MTSSGEKFLAFAATRNEGAFLLEWVCWYRMLGFDVLVGINDCTDHSPQLLSVLAEAGWLEFLEHSPAEGQPPKQSAHRAMRRHPSVAGTDWLLICDVDEFLVLHKGNGTIRSYLDDIGRDFLGIAFHWKCFGNGGWKRYRDGLVHRQFRRCGWSENKVNAMFKTLFRDPLRFKAYSDHAPWRFDGDWSAPENRIVDCEKRVIEKFLTDEHPIRFTAPDGITHQTAQMNHYVIRSDESFDLKRGTPSASAMKDRYTDRFYRARNRNGRKDLSAMANEAAFDAIYAEACAIPGVRRLHHLCCADYVERLCRNQGKRAEDDDRWQKHMDAAASLNP
ncbi:glycosyltransferase family 2 protein [Ponticoccus sp. SC2-23]|uniref:glycosyltransferase family 2 protein n=1 Tax=Alexandriicola marinus TaxID=2081710 RepID=UPI000FDC4044|nr:glycosyltransferase family 2 protein [Alexandriicola marinus]MBM1222020.1 glycosyltransferase family 2 protein [Ponticoccus sp. SC6-9]MBM1226371.1 glycosyltransferase family 2 protein [Ponticoccus sp. SC6-15]MBM1230967.1 glycosyltransferase family 2 protein [Ponticoccus sp. SC6-38]MBM1235192.1 glycosyltransferase family 2 protein [Ponticoccus sp. SC6-45]MBM1239989.1 glycosyltransferase family 2 protein [Ponticoccus sp. SC6-49]MBM1244133.1 glycosyltransferase family 2 protein [Ponticoccus s